MSISFGNWIQSELEKRGWSQGELSRRSGMSQGYISKLVNGQMPPSVGAVKTLSETFGETEETLMRISGLINMELTNDDPRITEATEIMRDLDEHDRETALDVLRTLYRRLKNKPDE